MTSEDNLHGWRDLARERLAEWKAERERRIKAEQEWDHARRERDSWRAQVPLADWEKELVQHSEQSRPLTPDAITDEMVKRALQVNSNLLASTVHRMLTAALTEPPARPEGAEKVEEVLHHYWSGEIDGDDLADRIAEEMNR